ncbi:MAG: hypothetical protein E7335_07055 [Clostridiales bacterium]|nr:hypothetical protein [Clostridiales bacterium]
MNRYYPLIRREAIRLLAPTAIALYTLGYQMWALGGSFQLWLWKFSTYENYSMHPSTLLKMDWFAFALLIGMVLSLVQHAGERSARPSLWWEKLPYSRWERLCVKTVCSMVPLILLCAVGFVWTKVILSDNSEWIARMNAGMNGINAAERLLQTDRLAIYWLFLLTGGAMGYAFFGLLCQIFGHWWRAVLIGAAVWILSLYCIPAMTVGQVTGKVVISGEPRWYTAQDMELLLPVVKWIAAGIAAMLTGTFLLEKRRPLERSGLAMLYPKAKWYVAGAIVVIGIAVMLMHRRLGYIPMGGVVVATLILFVTPFEISKKMKWKG